MGSDGHIVNTARTFLLLMMRMRPDSEHSEHAYQVVSMVKAIRNQQVIMEGTCNMTELFLFTGPVNFQASVVTFQSFGILPFRAVD